MNRRTRVGGAASTGGAALGPALLLALLLALPLSGLLSGFVGLPSTATTARADGSNDFVETFEHPSSLDRFRWQIHHSPNFASTPSTWLGDHDLSCGPPSSTRTIKLPPEGPDPGDTAYWCAPGGPGTGHLMTTFSSSGYAQVGFSPDQKFSHVGKVCWDQNMTNLGNRKWTQVVVVPEAAFQNNDQRLDYVKVDIQGPNRPGASGVKLTPSVFLFSMVDGSTATYTGQNIFDVDFRGYKNSDKMRRFTTCITDLEDGRVRIELERENSTEVRTLDGAFPDGPARVIFQDDTYNSTKAAASVPNPFTWHWDNILISSDVRAKPPSSSGASLPYAPAVRLS